MRYPNLLAVPLLALLLLTGCDPANNPGAEPGPDTISVFIVNEGNLNRANGSVSLYSKPDKRVTTLDLFRSANGRGLGDVVQSMTVRDNRAYLVVNNSNKIEVVSLPDFRAVGVVTGLHGPRYFLPVSATRGYVTQWGNFAGVRPGIKVVDLATYAVVDSILTGNLPERLVLAAGRVFVANSGGNTLTVIDPATNRVTSTLPVGDAPNSLAVDKNGLLWVACGGAVAYDPVTYAVDYAATMPGKLVSVNAAAATVASTRTFATNRLQPTDLHLNGAGDQLYFRAANAATFTGPVFRLGIADAALPVLTAPLIRRALYGLGVDPRTEVIYGGTGTFLGTDKLIRYQSSGAPLDSVAVGTGPNGFVFY